jgi:glucose/arabinose dehydrogenase
MTIMHILKSRKTMILSLTIIIVIASLYIPKPAQGETPSLDINSIHLPEGFSIQVYSKLPPSLKQLRMITFDSAGRLYAALANSNQVVMITDKNHDGVADEPVIVAEGLNAPNSIAFIGNDMLIANQDGIVKLTNHNGVWSKPQSFISDLPSGGHTLKTIRIGPDQHLYLNIGSSCNVCEERDANRATIMRYTLDGKPAGFLTTLGRHSASAIWAKGLRNSQGFAWHPLTGEFYATNEGADNRSDTKNGKVNDELPPEHLNIIKAGEHYGWPYCWGNPNGMSNMVQDPNFIGNADFCKSATPPVMRFTSHSTPIGITFLNKSNFPKEYQSDAIVALHGSWNRKDPSGYKLVRVKFKDNYPVEVVDFATGWLQGKSVRGRPIDVTVGPDGALYVSDDSASCIYIIRYQDKQKQ